MTVEYNSSRGDVLASYWFNWKNNPRLRWAQVRIALLVFGISVSMRAITRPVTLSDVIASGLWTIGVLAFLPIYPQLKFKPQRRMLTVDELGIATTIGTQSGQMPWSKVDFIRSTDRYIFIVGKNMNAFIVPERAFSSNTSRQQFLTWCTRCLAISQSSSAA